MKIKPREMSSDIEIVQLNYAPRQSLGHCDDLTFGDDSRDSSGAASPSRSPQPRSAPSRQNGLLEWKILKKLNPL